MNAITPAAAKALQKLATLTADEDGFASVKGQGISGSALASLCHSGYALRWFTAFSTARYQITDKGHAALAKLTAVEVDDVTVAEATVAEAAEARSFEGGDAHTCRTCATERPVTSFPTVGGGRRGTECRACRDARRTAR